jgi:hypothetical protein
VTSRQYGVKKVMRSRSLDAVCLVLLSNLFASDASSATVVAALPMLSSRTTHTATLLNDDSVLVAGGVASDGVVKSAELFDPRSLRFSKTGDPIWARYLHSATLLTDGRVLLVGGIGRANVIVANAEIYDPKTKSFLSAARLNVPRFEHCATRLADGRVLISGGFALGQLARRAEIYDPLTNSFTYVADLIWPRAGHVALLLPNGNVLIAAGRGRNPQGKPQVFIDTPWLTAEVFDAATLSFTSVGPLRRPRPYCGAVMLPDGRAAFFGGGESDAPYTSEFYSPLQKAFSRVDGPVGGPRLHTATLLPDGRVMLVGGVSVVLQNGQNLFSTIEFYDPRTNQFSENGSFHLQEQRHSHTATLLRDGRILIVGGVNRNGALSSAEVLSP